MADELKTPVENAEMSSNFIHTFIEKDIAEGGDYCGKKVHTRFPISALR